MTNILIKNLNQSCKNRQKPVRTMDFDFINIENRLKELKELEQSLLSELGQT